MRLCVVAWQYELWFRAPSVRSPKKQTNVIKVNEAFSRAFEFGSGGNNTCIYLTHYSDLILNKTRILFIVVWWWYSPRIQAVYGLLYSDGSIIIFHDTGPVNISKSILSLNYRASDDINSPYIVIFRTKLIS